MNNFLTPTDFILYYNTFDAVKKYTQEVCMDLNAKYATLHTKSPI
jgi:hypothetical protein